MEIKVRSIGSSIVEMTVEDCGTVIATDVTDMNGLVPIELINNLKEIAEELEQHNQALTNNK